MIGKIANKDSIALLFMTMVSVVALVYGLTTIPSPGQQRDLKLDHKRVSDLGELQSSIDNYYYDNSALPTSLNQLKTNTYSYSTKLNKVDPETGATYQYQLTSETSYSLCASFKTDSTQEDDYVYDETNYNYSSFKSKFPHTIGQKCFDFKVTPRYNYNSEATPTPGVTLFNYPLQGSSSGTKY